MSAIKISYKNRDYILEFSRRTAGMIERGGFNYEEVGTKPNLMIPMLLQGAFAKNHASVKPGKIDEIYDEIADKNGFVQKLVELYLETITSLVDEKEEGNATWETV